MRFISGQFGYENIQGIFLLKLRRVNAVELKTVKKKYKMTAQSVWQQIFSAKSLRFTNSWLNASFKTLYVADLPSLRFHAISMAKAFSRHNSVSLSNPVSCALLNASRRPSGLHSSTFIDRRSSSSSDGHPSLTKPTKGKGSSVYFYNFSYCWFAEKSVYLRICWKTERH